MKILKNSEYEELLDYKKKYEDLTGKRWYVVSGGRSTYSRLMQLSKESLINLLLEMRQDFKNISKKLKRSNKCILEPSEDQDYEKMVNDTINYVKDCLEHLCTVDEIEILNKLGYNKDTEE